MKVTEKLKKLREIMNMEGCDACIFTTADDHGSEYVCDHYKTREFFSGFTGSNGDLLVMEKIAGLWTDGRYFIQINRHKFF